MSEPYGNSERVKLPEEAFYNALKSVPIGFAIESLEGQPLFVNPTLCSMLGFSEQELLNKHCADFSPPEDAEKDSALFQQLREGLIDHYSLDKHYFRRNGSLMWGRLNISLMRQHSTTLAVAMVQDITDRKLAQEALRKSEERYCMAAQAGRMFAYEWDAGTDVIVRSEGVAQVLGEDERSLATGEKTMHMVPPEDRKRLIAAVAELSPEQPQLRISYRIVRADGSVIWVERTSRAHFDEQGKMLRIVGMVADVTERKVAEDALSRMNQKLIEAHEEERTRIARELHDDINQRLGLLAVNLEALQKDPLPTAEIMREIADTRKQLEELARDVQGLSHRLHSSKLEYLGLIGAAAGVCREFSGRQGVQIDFHSENIPKDLPKGISLCLFRVLQEALQNAIKHSGCRQFQVSLIGGSSEIELTVRDSGIGFDPEEAMKGRGLGLSSMRERLKLASGSLSIDSQPQRGTTIHAHVPLTATMQSMGAA